jgi:hypothetical protein
MGRESVSVGGMKVVYVRIVGERATREEQAKHDLPLCPNDHGLCEALHKWMDSVGIQPYRLMSSGGGQYTAMFEERDGWRVVTWCNEWLRGEGRYCECEKPITGAADGGECYFCRKPWKPLDMEQLSAAFAKAKEAKGEG